MSSAALLSGGTIAAGAALEAGGRRGGSAQRVGSVVYEASQAVLIRHQRAYEALRELDEAVRQVALLAQESGAGGGGGG